jgi:hypothetical protein
MEQKTRWIRFQNQNERGRTCHDGIQTNVLCDGSICQTDKKCSRSPICVHKEQTLGPQGWIVSQRSFITGARSLNEKNLHDNLTYFKILTVDIESIRSKLDFKILDEHAYILKGMYSTRFNGCPENKGDHDQMDTAPGGPSCPSSPLSKPAT